MLKQNLAVNKGVVTSDTYRNPVLENVLFASYQNPAHFVARQLFGTVPGAAVGKTWKISRGASTKNTAQGRAPGTEAQAGRFEMTEDTYKCKPVSYKEILPDDMLANLPIASSIAMENVAQILRIGSEMNFASAFWKTGVWGKDIAGAASTVADTSYKYWSDAAATPGTDIKAEKKRILLACGQEANTLVLGYDVETYLTEHPNLITRLNGGQTSGAATVTLEYLAAIFGVQRVITAKAAYNSSASETPTFTTCLNSKSALLCYVNPRPGIMQTTCGLRYTDAVTTGNNEGVRSWEMPDPLRHSLHIEGQVDECYALVDNTCGVYFNGIVQ